MGKVETYPEQGVPRFEQWLESSDKDVRWIMRENLKKKRLIRMDAAWVERCRKKLLANTQK